MIVFATELEEFGIEAAYLKVLSQQGIDTVGALLRAVNNTTSVTTEKIAAIKQIREMTGLGLKEAKEIADLGLPPENWAVPTKEYDKKLTTFGISADSLTALHKQGIETVGNLLIVVNKTNPVTTEKTAAVKQIKEMTGLGLKEAKEIADLGLPPKKYTPTPLTELKFEESKSAKKTESVWITVKIEKNPSPLKDTSTSIPEYNKTLADVGLSANTLNILHDQDIDTVGELLRAVNKTYSVTAEKLAAVKQIREMTGLGLKDAKDIVDLDLPPESWTAPASIKYKIEKEAMLVTTKTLKEYNKKTADLGISADKLNALHEQGIDTVGELLRAANKIVSLTAEKMEAIKLVKEMTGLGLTELKKIIELGLPPENWRPQEEIIDLITEFYLTLPEILTEIGKGIGKAQRELDIHAVAVQNSILKDKELADYGINATWYTIPEAQFNLKMEYSLTEQKTEEGEIGNTPEIIPARRITVLPPNMKYNELFESTRKEESTLSIKFKPVPPPDFTFIRTEVPNLYGMTKPEAEAMLFGAGIKAVFEFETDSEMSDSERKVVWQAVSPGDFLLEDEKLTVVVA